MQSFNLLFINILPPKQEVYSNKQNNIKSIIKQKAFNFRFFVMKYQIQIQNDTSSVGMYVSVKKNIFPCVLTLNPNKRH